MYGRNERQSPDLGYLVRGKRHTRGRRGRDSRHGVGRRTSHLRGGRDDAAQHDGEHTFTFTDTFASGLTVHVYEVNG